MQTISLPRRLPLTLFACCAAVAFAGCTTTGLFTTKKGLPQATAKNPAVEILAIWQPAEGRGDNGVPTRGFAGQFLFFTGGNPSPVEVDGAVRIYLFDDRGTPEQQAKPVHQFDFDSGSWKSHLKKSALGPAYHVFIPYPRKDDQMARCSLRVRLMPTDGPTIYSESANVVLPGTTDDSAQNVAKGEQSEQKAEKSESIDDAEARRLISERLEKMKRNPSAQSAARAANAKGNRTSQKNAPIATVTTSRNRTVIQTVGYEEAADVEQSDGEFEQEAISDVAVGVESAAPVRTAGRRSNPLSDDETY